MKQKVSFGMALAVAGALAGFAGVAFAQTGGSMQPPTSGSGMGGGMSGTQGGGQMMPPMGGQSGMMSGGQKGQMTMPSTMGNQGGGSMMGGGNGGGMGGGMMGGGDNPMAPYENKIENVYIPALENLGQDDEAGMLDDLLSQMSAISDGDGAPDPSDITKLQAAAQSVKSDIASGIVAIPKKAKVTAEVKKQRQVNTLFGQIIKTLTNFIGDADIFAQMAGTMKEMEKQMKTAQVDMMKSGAESQLKMMQENMARMKERQNNDQVSGQYNSPTGTNSFGLYAPGDPRASSQGQGNSSFGQNQGSGKQSFDGNTRAGGPNQNSYDQKGNITGPMSNSSGYPQNTGGYPNSNAYPMPKNPAEAAAAAAKYATDHPGQPIMSPEEAARQFGNGQNTNGAQGGSQSWTGGSPTAGQGGTSRQFQPNAGGFNGQPNTPTTGGGQGQGVFNHNNSFVGGGSPQGGGSSSFGAPSFGGPQGAPQGGQQGGGGAPQGGAPMGGGAPAGAPASVIDTLVGFWQFLLGRRY